MSFANKVVVITGASSGIGAATAELFAERGAKLVIVGRNVTNLKATEKLCKAANKNVECLMIAVDVTSDAEKIIKGTIEKYGRLDVLVNNAGIMIAGDILDGTVEQFDDMFNTNVRAVYILTKLATPYLLESQGNIVNISSVAGSRSFSGLLSYCMSKAAIDQFTKCVALDLGPKNVRVNAVNPGVIVTEIHKRSGMSEEDYAKYLERCKSTHAMGRVGNVIEVAKTIAFLASDDASFITGVTLPVDGGKHAMCPR